MNRRRSGLRKLSNHAELSDSLPRSTFTLGKEIRMERILISLSIKRPSLKCTKQLFYLNFKQANDCRVIDNGLLS